MDTKFLQQFDGKNMAAPDQKTRNTFIALAALAALAGAVIGALLVRQWSPPRPAGPAPEARIDPELAASLKDMAKELGEMREEQNGIRLQVNDLYARLAPSDDSGFSDSTLRAALAPPYLKKVDDFFQSANARTLLSAKAQTRPNIKFGQPMFVSSSVITVPYSISGKQEYLMIGIKILDYYDLQFDVLWDSAAGEQH